MTQTTYRRFGRELKVSPKSLVEMSEEGATVVIKIGQHRALLFMPIEAFEAFTAGENVKIETAKELKSQLYKY